MSLFYFLFYVRHVKSQRSKVKSQNYKVDSETPFSQSPESDGTRDSDSSQAGMTDSEQVGMTDNSASSFWRSPESGKPADADSRQAGMTGREEMTDNSASGTLTSKVTPLLFLLPGIWFLVTSLWSSYPEVSAARALYFILISTGCISAGVLWIRYSGRNIFELLLPANIIVVLICLFSILTNIPSDSWTAGHGKGFIGFFGHQNLLASVILFTLPGLIFKLRSKAGVNSNQSSVNRNHKSNTNYFLLTTHYLLLTANLLLITLTYSRASMLSLVFGTIVFLILNKNWKILSYSFTAAAVITSIIYLNPAMNNFADKILKKDFPKIYSSRMWMWEPSYQAALEGGVIGLGYGISHPEIRSGEYSDRFEDGRLIREKGNSTLALIEETGLIGLVLFLIPIFYILLRVFADKVSLLTAALAAFLLHAQFEGWWVGVGSVQLPLFFIYFGLIVQCSKFNSSRLESY